MKQQIITKLMQDFDEFYWANETDPSYGDYLVQLDDLKYVLENMPEDLLLYEYKYLVV